MADLWRLNPQSRFCGQRSYLTRKSRILSASQVAIFEFRRYCNLAYSALAWTRVGRRGSASFQRVRKS